MLAYAKSLCALVVALAALPGFADTTITTPDGATNKLGESVRGAAKFTVHTDNVVIHLTNNTPNIRSYDQTITALSFKIAAKTANVHMGFSQAIVRVVGPEGSKDSPQLQDTRWLVSMKGTTVTVRAPGQRFAVLPDSPEGVYHKADESIVGNPFHNPFLTKTVMIQVVFPDSGLTEDLGDVKFYWGPEDGLPGAKLSSEPGDLNDGTEGGIGGVPGEVTDVIGGTLIPIGGGVGSSGGSTGGGGGGGGGGDGGGGGTVTPLTPDTPPVEPTITPLVTLPEPTSLAVLAAGAASLLARRRRRV